MKLDELTIGEAKQLAALFGNANAQPAPAAPPPHIGKKCIIRAYASGVFFGTLTAQDGRQVELANSRRLWLWNVEKDGISLSEASQTGIVHAKSRVCTVVPQMTILDALEIIPCSELAIANIEGAEVYKP